MKNNNSKKARYAALTNAAEFIRGHGEEGGMGDEDFEDFDEKTYIREKNKIAERLSREAARYKRKHKI